MQPAVRATVRVGASVVLALIAMLGRPHPQRATVDAEPPSWFGDRAAAPVRIAGRVFGATGPSAVMVTLDVGDSTLWRGRDVEVSADGSFELVLRPGRYLVAATALDGSAGSRALAVDATHGAVTDLELFAYPCRRFEGTATLHGIPVPYVPVRDELGRVVATSGYDGRFAGCGFDGWLPPPLPVTIDPPTIWRGRLVHADGSPVAFVGVQVFWNHLEHDDYIPSPEVATTDRDGQFTVRTPDPVPWRLYGMRVFDGPRIHAVVVDRPPAEVTTVELVDSHETFHKDHPLPYGDPAGAWIRGRVLRDGQRVPDARVETVERTRITGDATRTRSDGTFALFLSAGKPEDVLVAASSRSGRGRAWIAPGTRDAIVTISGTVTVRGHVVDRSGLPVPGARVSWRAADARWQQVPTGPDGGFELAVSGQGRYRLHAFVDGDVEYVPAGIPPAIDVTDRDDRIDDARLVVERRTMMWSGGDVALAGLVDLGVRLDDSGAVAAVSDEAAAAGTRVGDVWLDARGYWVPLEARFGETVTWKVRRGTRVIELHAQAPSFHR
ncbi:MAG TPA: carboxypeptidase-like regulatory domain-containing protein [Kofleriaceae bacterium]|nr:carboxypeptidase-like regulatory domain-containing protein [Kofleriaceae bacterium]